MPDKPPSALLGDPPLTDRDALIQKAMRQYRTIFSANPKHPFGPSHPVPPAPDLANESNAWRVLTAASCLLFLVIVVTAGRFWFRWQRRRQMGFGVDDVLIIPAVALAITYVVQIIEEVTQSCLGKHMWFCTYEDVELMYHSFTIDQLMWYISVYFAKLSLFFFIRRLTLSTMSRIYHWTNILLFTIVLLAGLVSIFMTALQCRPFSARWSYITLARTDPATYSCISLQSSQTALRALHISTDILLLLYPTLILYRIQMPLRKKLAISIVFSLGLFSVVCSVVRNIIFGYTRPDETFMIHDIDIWNMADVCSACMTACLPAHYPLFLGLYKRVRHRAGWETEVEQEKEPEEASGELDAGPGSREGAKSSAGRAKEGKRQGKGQTVSDSVILGDVEGEYEAADDKSVESGERNLIAGDGAGMGHEVHISGPSATSKVSGWKRLSKKGRESQGEGDGEGNNLRRNVFEMVDRGNRGTRGDAAV